MQKQQLLKHHSKMQLFVHNKVVHKAGRISAASNFKPLKGAHEYSVMRAEAESFIADDEVLHAP